jgi:phosphate transport system substrate-binding protein
MEEAEAAGVHPVEHVVAYDGIAVIVNPANPLDEISVGMLSDVYVGRIRDWGEAGAPGLGEIQVISRDSASGTYEVFRDTVVTLGGTDRSRDYAPEALRKASNQIIVTLVSQSRGAIGYVGLGYLNADVKPLSIVPLAGGDAVAPAVGSVRDGSYPVARSLYCYTNGEPTGAVKQYLDWVMGPEGQAIVEQLGFVPAGAEE